MNKKYKSKRKIIISNKGITLVALAIIIIMLLILSIVVINLTIGNNGILKRAEEATNLYDEKTIDENLRMLYQEQLIDDAIGKISRDETDVFLEMTKGKEVTQEDIERFNNALEKFSKKLYGIWTIEDLRSIGNSEEYPLDGIYIQFEDIVIGEEGISPIGNAENPFTGIYNGNGKKIEELNIKAGGENIGLFGVNNGKIENVTVEGYDLEVNYAQTGSIAGANSGIITKCTNNNGKIHSNGNNDGSRVGGIVGLNKENGLVEGCTNNSNISGEYKLVGGIVGFNNGGDIENCENNANIIGPVQVGGIVGWTNHGTKDADIYVKNNINYGSVEGTSSSEISTSIGGIAGGNGTKSILINNENNGVIQSNGIVQGGIAGMNYYNIERCYNKGEIINTAILGDNPMTRVGGIVGYSIGNIKECYNIADVHGEKENATFIGGIVGSINSTNYEGIGNVLIENCYNTGKISGKTQIGGIAGRVSSEASMESCYNTGEIEGNNCVGGIAGETVQNTGYIANSYNKGKVTADTIHVGGIIGIIRSKIENCYNSGNVEIKSTNDRIGGLFGALDIEYMGKEEVKNCYYLNTSYSKACGNESNIGNIEGAKSVTDEQLKNSYEILGNKFKKNEEGDMYPKLIWE